MTIDTQVCEQCHAPKPLADFNRAINGVVKRPQIWCAECRTLDPRGAKLARDAYYARQKTPEHNREKHQAYKEAHPERLKRRSEQEMQRVAAAMMLQGVEHAKKLARSQCRELGYTRGQIAKVVGMLDTWSKMFEVEEA